MNKKLIVAIIVILIALVSFLTLYFALPGNVHCDYNDPNKNYVFKNQNLCEVADLGCPKDTPYFQDECGCGCRSPA